MSCSYLFLTILTRCYISKPGKGEKALSLNAYLYVTEAIQERMVYGPKEVLSVRVKRMGMDLKKLDREIAGNPAHSERNAG
jgi:hypothetical protein